MDGDYRKMWADYWALRGDFIRKFKNLYPESEFIAHALNSDFYPSCLEKPFATVKRQRTVNEAKMAEEPCEKKRRESTPNEANCASFRPKSRLEPNDDEISAEINELNDEKSWKIDVEINEEDNVIDAEINEENDKLDAELKNFDLLVAEKSKTRNPDSSSDTYQPVNRRGPNDFANNLPLVAQFTANYSTFKYANYLTLAQKVALALTRCDFTYTWQRFTTEGVNGIQKSVGELYFQHFLVATGGGNSSAMAEESAFKQLTNTMANFQNFGSWNFGGRAQPIDVEDAKHTELVLLMTKLAQVAEIIKNTKSNILNPKTLLNEAFRKCKMTILWTYFCRPKERKTFCDLIAMNKFRLSCGAGLCEMDAARNAAVVFLGKIDTLLVKSRVCVPSLDLFTQGNVIASKENPFILWEKSYLESQNAYSILCDSAQRNGKKLKFKVGNNRCDVILDSEIISTLQKESKSTIAMEMWAATEALKQLKKSCYTIQEKKQNYGFTIFKDDLISEISVGNVCQKIATFYSDEQIVTVKPKSSGDVRANMVYDEYVKLLSRRISNILVKYELAEYSRGLVFSSEFSLNETKIISKIAKKLHLLCWSGVRNYQYYSVVEKRVDIQILLNSLRTDHPTEDFDLIPPA